MIEARHEMQSLTVKYASKLVCSIPIEQIACDWIVHGLGLCKTECF